MNCKNCQDPLEKDAQFCDNCGAKIITNRITFKFLVSEIFFAIGIESLYFNTLKKMFLAPQEVLNEYINGVRKRYINPFAYLAVGAALSLLVFNYFADDFIEIQSSVNKENITKLQHIANRDLSSISNISDVELQQLKQQQQTAQLQLQFQVQWTKLLLKYLNLITFLFLPVYALISKWTYRKPYNYGEHIVMNAYLQGTTMYISIITFFIAMVSHPLVYTFSMLVYILYYLFAFSKLYKHSFKTTILKLLRFIVVFIIVFILLIIIAAILLVAAFIIIKWLNPELLESTFGTNT